MYLHIQFKDGSNPFLKYGTESELLKEMKRWGRRFKLLVDYSFRYEPGGKSKVVGFNVLAVRKGVDHII